MADDLNTYRGWLAEAKRQNPDVPEQALADYWQSTYARAPAAADKPGLLSDTGSALKSGVYGMAASARELGRRVFGDAIGDAFDSFDEAIGFVPAGPEPYDARLLSKMQEIESGMSPEMQEARRKDWWNEEEESFGSAWTDPRAYYSAVVESIPGTAGTMVPAGLLARGVGKIALNQALAKGLTQEAAEKAAGSAIATTAQVAGGALEGLQQAGSTGFEVRTTIERLPEEVIAQSEGYLALIEGGLTPDEARAQLATDASTQSMLLAGTVTALFGGQGDKMLAKAIRGQMGGNVWQRMAKGFVAEGLLEEGPQGYGSAVAKNIGLIEAGMDIEPTAGALNETLGGIVAGGIMGAGFAAPFGARETELTAKAMDDVQKAASIDELGAVVQTWNEAQSAAVAESLTRTLGMQIQAADVFRSEEAAKRAILEARARGELVDTIPFEAVPPEGIEGAEPQTGVFLARNVPLQETEGRPSFVFETEEAAQKLDPTGERLRVELAPGGFTVMPVPGAAAKNMADLQESQTKEAERLLKLSADKAASGDVAGAAKVAGFASFLRQTTYSAAPDAAVPGAPFVRAVANMFGADVQFFTSSNPNAANGWVIAKNGRRVLYINAKSTKPHMQVMGHELSHYLEVSEPALYKQAQEKLAPLFRQYAKDEIAKRYSGMATSEEGLTKELMGDLFGAEMGNKQLWQEMSKQEPTLFRSIAKRVLQFIDQIVQAIRSGKIKGFDRRTVSDITAARKVIAETLVQTARNVESRRQTAKQVAGAEAAQMDTQREEGQKFPREPAREAVPMDATSGMPVVQTEEGRLPLMSFGENYERLNGKKVKLKVAVAESGKTGTLTLDAGAEMRSLDKRESALNELLNCIKR